MSIQHRCHVPGCERRCRSSYLMCGQCWALVPLELATPVYTTVLARRGSKPDATWAPWWRAAHEAIAHVLRVQDKAAQAESLIRRAHAFADLLEQR